MENTWAESAIVMDGLRKLQLLLFQDKMESLGFDYLEGEDLGIQQKRTLIISILAKCKENTVVNELLRRVEKYFAGEKSALHPEIRGVGFKTLLANSNDPDRDFDRVLQVMKDGASLDERMAAMRYIGSTTKTSLAERILSEVIFDESYVKPQDFYVPVASLSLLFPDSAYAKNLLSNWLIQNWESVFVRFKNSMGLLRNLANAAFGRCVGEAYITKILDWSVGRDCTTDEQRKIRLEQIAVIDRPIAQLLEALNSNTNWYKREDENVRNWFISKDF
jgi:aminopeptidase 2